MTEKEYLAALKFRNKTLSESKINLPLLVLAALAAAAVLLGVLGRVEAAAAALLAFAAGCIMLLIKRKSEKDAFKTSPLLNAPHLVAFDKGLEITNNFEKITCPDFNIFAAGQTGEYLFIIPTLRKGCFCINKSRYASPALESLIAALNGAGKIKGDK